MSIKPIETRYKAHRFRSRLEARWAVFFDALGVQWEYEPQGFELTPLPAERLKKMQEEWLREPQPEDGKHLGVYLPDFWLPDQATWFEVKGAPPGRWRSVQGLSGHPSGSPRPVPEWSVRDSPRSP
ncbi:hypothetical protein [Streptomyces griseomycini]|uniref:Uncharacterized protein n=1 Tax=Streptomyces griseomycini TaxID=66895 RepID=A0A7W7PXW0_9ACTN|nr:hypothetical protein [Streptomyces griseomycini]MBB4903289.1 hypothetical protein [Streptomyces griseomycini]GGR43737.1 hypothetical protein GCM10015536_57120 [Streptomyces griseomycini]